MSDEPFVLIDHLCIESGQGWGDVADAVHTLAGEMERLGIATAEELGQETLAERVFAQVTATESVVVGRAEIGACSHT
jgi:hypothetical protein